MVEVLIENTHRLDVFEGFDFSFNYSIADIRTPESRQTEYSKTVQCPATHSNNQLFGHIFEVNGGNPFDSTQPNVGYNFNPNKKARAVILQDGAPVFTGTLQLRKIPITDNVMTYEVVFLGRTVDLFTKLGKKQLNGVDEDGNPHIDFSDIDHLLTAANQQTSWTAQIGEGYVYPLIDYGHSFGVSPTGHKTYRVDQLLPALYLKDVVDRIFEFANVTYTSDFFESVLWSRLILPFGEGTYSLDDAANANLSFLARSDADQVGGFVAFQTENVGIPEGFAPNTQLNWMVETAECGNEINDAGNNYNDTTWTFTGPSNRQHQFGARIKGSSEVTAGVGGVGTYIGIGCKVGRVRNGVLDFPFESAYIEVENFSTNYVVGETVSWDVSFVSPLIDVETGDTFKLYAQLYQASVVSHTWEHTLGIDTAFYNVPRLDGLFEGETVIMQNTLPDVAMRELMISIVQMFNLYVEVDPTNETNLLIEPRDDYYDNSDTVRDWTHKLDRRKKIEITPVSTVVSNKYEFAYTEDGDYYNSRYQNTHARTYGSRRVEIDNDFNTGSKDIEVVFSPTPMVNDGDSSRIIPKIYDEDVSEGAQTYGANVRILYYGGLIASTPIWQHAQGTTWAGTAATLYENMETYPYAGHLDDPINPNIDLSFGIPLQLFYAANGNTGALNYTNGNLFNLYHSRHYAEITHKDGKLLTGMFRLRHLDIKQLNFADMILIDNAFWRLNKVENYNPFKEGLAKCELIKVIDQPNFKADPAIKSIGTSGSGITTEKNPVRRSNAKRNHNDYDPTNGNVRGKGNRVGPDTTDFIVLGDNNAIGNGGRNIFIQGNDNTVAPGLRNVTIMGTSGVDVTESNTTYNNGRHETQRGIVDGGFDVVTPLNAATSTRVVDSGLDAIQNDSGHNDIYLIDGNG